jgi:hypothetical protein
VSFAAPHNTSANTDLSSTIIVATSLLVVITAPHWLSVMTQSFTTQWQRLSSIGMRVVFDRPGTVMRCLQIGNSADR